MTEKTNTVIYNESFLISEKEFERAFWVIKCEFADASIYATDDPKDAAYRASLIIEKISELPNTELAKTGSKPVDLGDPANWVWVNPEEAGKDG